MTASLLTLFACFVQVVISLTCGALQGTKARYNRRVEPWSRTARRNLGTLDDTIGSLAGLATIPCSKVDSGTRGGGSLRAQACYPLAAPLWSGVGDQALVTLKGSGMYHAITSRGSRMIAFLSEKRSISGPASPDLDTMYVDRRWVDLRTGLLSLLSPR